MSDRSYHMLFCIPWSALFAFNIYAFLEAGTHAAQAVSVFAALFCFCGAIGHAIRTTK